MTKVVILIIMTGMVLINGDVICVNNVDMDDPTIVLIMTEVELSVMDVINCER
jgi:hypothetical protein